MPAQLFILRHWKKQLQFFLQNLETLRKNYNPGAVHDLRVAVKRLRAYLKLLALLYKQQNHRQEFEGIEQLFSILGKHRDIEIGHLLLEEFEKENQLSYTAVKDHFKKALNQATAWMQLALASYDEKEIRELTMQLQQELKSTNRQELLDKIRIVIEKEHKKGKRHAQQLAKDAHAVRKVYKDIFYQAELCPVNILPAGMELKKIKKALDQLGSWQDHEMLHRKIKHFRKDFVPDAKEEYELLKELEKDILDKKEKLLQKAKNLI